MRGQIRREPEVGDLVRISRRATKGRGKIGRLLHIADFQTRDGQTVRTGVVEVDQDASEMQWAYNPADPGKERFSVALRNIRRVLTPPQFASVEEAQAWLDEQESLH